MSGSRKLWPRKDVARQILLIPEIVELPEEDAARLAERAPDLEKVGLSLEAFGPGAIAVRETPAILGDMDVKGLVQNLADELRRMGHGRWIEGKTRPRCRHDGLPWLRARRPAYAPGRNGCALAGHGGNTPFGGNAITVGQPGLN